MVETDNWDLIEAWISNWEEGRWAENGSRGVECVCMCGGKYLMSDKGGHVGLTDCVDEAIEFLKGEKA